MRGTPSEAGKRRRAIGLPKDSAEVRRLEKFAERNEDVSHAAVINRILEKQADTFRLAGAQLIAAVPAVIGNLVRIALGSKGRPSDQVAAGKTVLELARFGGAGKGPLAGLPANLSELPLDQLESLLAGTLEHVRDLRAVESSSHPIDAAHASLPDVGSDGHGPPA